MTEREDRLVGKHRGAGRALQSVGRGVRHLVRAFHAMRRIFRATALTRSGLAEILPPARWTLAPLAPHDPAPTDVRGHVDNPADGSETPGDTVVVEGWVAPARAVDRVEVTVGERGPETARLFCHPRPDLPDRLDDPTSVMAGYSHIVDLSGSPPGTRLRLLVEAVHGKERTRLGQRDVVVGGLPQPDEDARAWVGALRARAEIAVRDHPAGRGLRLLVVAHDLGVGGAQVWLWEVLRRLLGGPDVACTVTAPADGPMRRDLEALGARVHVHGGVPGAAGAYESKVRELAQVAAGDGCNVVLANTLGAFVGVDVASVCSLPSVLAVHEHYAPAVFAATAFAPGALDAHVASRVRASLERASAVCFVSDATAELQCRHAAIAPERSLRIDYGIDLLRIHDERQAVDRATRRADYGFASGSVVVVCVGTVEPRKGQAALVLAFDRVADDFPDAHLVMIGGQDTPYARGVADLVRALGRERQVRIIGVTGDVVPWYAIADAMVLASDVESLPRVLIEAMALGVPVLSTDVGGVAELVIDGETGLICTPRDIAGLAHGLRRLLRMSGDERATLARRAVGVISPARDVSGYTASFERLLRTLAANPTTDPRTALTS